MRFGLKRALRMAVPIMGACTWATPLWADDTELWLTASAQVNLGSGWRVQDDLSYRTSDERGFFQLIQHVMLGRKLDDHVTVWLGYTHDAGYNHGSLTSSENRFRQQINLDNIATLGPLALSARTRMEGRWRDATPGNAWRLRQQVKLSMPLAGKTTLALSHESFVNLSTTAFQRTAGYDRMRNAVTVTLPLVQHIKVDLGYMEQHIFARRAPDSDSHVVTLGLNAAF